MEIPHQYIKNLYRVSFFFLLVLSLFFTVKLLDEIRSYGVVGIQDMNTITLSGYGEVFAAPDIANINFTIRKEAETVTEAQEAVALVEKDALDFLKNNNIREKDIKTINASFNPKYEYRYDTKSVVPCNEFCPPRIRKRVISGYEAYESITIKVRNIEDVGKIIEGLGGLSVTNLNGPNFAIDDEDDLKALARKKAIDDARAKAKVLAKDLGVRLGRIASFSENGSGFFPLSVYAERVAISQSSAKESSPAQIPTGENTISSNVNITYEIR